MMSSAKSHRPLVLVSIAILTAACSTDVYRTEAHAGLRLTGSVIVCTSQLVTAAGYRRDITTGKVERFSEISRQRNVTAWRITLAEGGTANVIPFTGATQTVDSPQVFAVQRTDDALALARHDGLTTEAITIDLTNGSFVYAGSDVGLAINRTNLFVGSCRPHV